MTVHKAGGSNLAVSVAGATDSAVWRAAVANSQQTRDRSKEPKLSMVPRIVLEKQNVASCENSKSLKAAV